MWLVIAHLCHLIRLGTNMNSFIGVVWLPLSFLAVNSSVTIMNLRILVYGLGTYIIELQPERVCGYLTSSASCVRSIVGHSSGKFLVFYDINVQRPGVQGMKTWPDQLADVHRANNIITLEQSTQDIYRTTG